MKFHELNMANVVFKGLDGLNPCDFQWRLHNCEARYHNYGYILRNQTKWRIVNVWRVGRLLYINDMTKVNNIIHILSESNILLEFMKGIYMINFEKHCEFINDNLEENGLFGCDLQISCIHKKKHAPFQGDDFCRKYNDYQIGEEDVAIWNNSIPSYVRYLMEQEGLYSMCEGIIIYDFHIYEAIDVLGIDYNDIPF